MSELKIFSFLCFYDTYISDFSLTSWSVPISLLYDLKVLLFFRLHLKLFLPILHFLHNFIYAYSLGYNLCWKLRSKYAQKVVHYIGLELIKCLIYIFNLSVFITEFKYLDYFSVGMFGLSPVIYSYWFESTLCISGTRVTFSQYISVQHLKMSFSYITCSSQKNGCQICITLSSNLRSVTNFYSLHFTTSHLVKGLYCKPIIALHFIPPQFLHGIIANLLMISAPSFPCPSLSHIFIHYVKNIIFHVEVLFHQLSKSFSENIQIFSCQTNR